jgi:hypothetical protein
LSALSQSLRAAPVMPAHELACVAARGGVVAGAALVVAEVEVPLLVAAWASKGVTNASDIAHAIALIVHRFINPPFAKRNRS